MEELEIEWYGPYNVSTVVDEFLEYQDFGVYMITRKWGDNPNKILYLGMTYRQDFGTRLSQHLNDWLCNIKGTCKVRVGYLNELRPSAQRLKHAENLLICWNAPDYNKRDLIYRGRELSVINTGRRGPLDRVIESDDLDWE